MEIAIRNAEKDELEAYIKYEQAKLNELNLYPIDNQIEKISNMYKNSHNRLSMIIAKKLVKMFVHTDCKLSALKVQEMFCQWKYFSLSIQIINLLELKNNFFSIKVDENEDDDNISIASWEIIK